MNKSNNPCTSLVSRHFPELKRLNYCHGQMLGAQDFVDEQSYFLNKIALLTRCLDGYGVVCGLTVHANPDAKGDSNPKDYKVPEKGYQFRIHSGVAVDSRGRELVNRTPERKLSLAYCDSPDNDDASDSSTHEFDWCSETDRQEFQRKRGGSSETFDVWVTIHYQADLDGKQDLPMGGCCGDEPRSIKNRWNERPRFCLTFDCPPAQTCDSCCSPIEETRLWLAKLTFMAAPNPILLSVDNTVRRHITTYETTRIGGVNWIHTGVYEEELAERLMSCGLTIEFTAPIDVQSLMNHTVRLSEGGKYIETNDLVEVAISDELDINKNNPLQILQAQIVPVIDGNQECRKITVKLETRRLAPPLRVLLTVRTEFILDKRCKAVDGCNVGGVAKYVGWNHGDAKHPEEQLKRTVREYEERFHSPASCSNRDLTHRRASGNGVPGSNFQSWFYVVGDECMTKYDTSKPNDASA